MTKEGKLKRVQKLSEVQLRKDLMIQLFKKVDKFKDVRDCHGSNEFGIDISFYEEIGIDERLYYGVQLKTEDISGTSGKKGNIKTIIDQAEEAHNKGFYCVEEKRDRSVDRFLLVTTRDIASKAEQIIRDALAKHNLGKLISFWNGEKLVEYIEKHYPEYFLEEYEHFVKYFNAMKAEFEAIKDISAIGQKEPVPLEEIYVSLRLVEPEAMREREIYPEEEKKIFKEERRKIDEERRLMKGKIYDAERAVRDFDRLVIVGVPGSGKTTLLRHLALKSCDENLKKQERTCVPILITLRELLESKKQLREYLDDVFERYQFPKAKDFIEKDLNDGKCRLLLDGFDELATKESQEKIAEQIQGFIENYYKNQIVVTSRVAGYHDELKGFTKLELMEFDDRQIEQFISNWFGKTNPEKAKSMSYAIKQNEQIKALARNPLMIAIIAIIYEEDRKLPQKRAALYNRCVEVLLSRWDVQRRIKNIYPSDKKEFILRKLAFYAHSENKRILSEKEVIGLIRKYLAQARLKEEDIKPFIDEIWKRSYLLRQISMDSYDFLHLSFQEYFTALELKDQADGISTIIEHLQKPWWEEPTLLYAGISKDATALIERIKREVPEDIFYSNLMLFGKCVADAEFTEPSLREKIINDLWSLYQEAEFDPPREKAIKVLAQIKPDSIVDLLIKNLKNKRAAVRGRAAEALGRIGSEKAIGQLINALADKGRYVRVIAAVAVGRIGSEAAIEPLINALTDEERDIQWLAAHVLGRIGSEKAIEPLINALADKERNVRWGTAYALGNIGSEAAIEPLINALADKDSGVRGSTAEALGRIGSEKAIGQLINALADKGRYVRVRAAEALGSIGSEKAIEPLMNALADKDIDFRGSAADALGSIGSEKAVEPLKKALLDEGESPWGRIKNAAFSALERISKKNLIRITEK